MACIIDFTSVLSTLPQLTLCYLQKANEIANKLSLALHLHMLAEVSFLGCRGVLLGLSPG